MEVELQLSSLLPVVELLVDPPHAMPALHPSHFRCSRRHAGNAYVAGPCSWEAALAVLDVVTHELLVAHELLEDSQFRVRMWLELELATDAGKLLELEADSGGVEGLETDKL